MSDKNTGGAAPEHPTEQDYRRKLSRHLFRASHRWHREAAGLPDTEESFETAWAADAKTRSLFNCMAAWTIREIAEWDRQQVTSGIYSTQVGNERYAQLVAAEAQLAEHDRVGKLTLKNIQRLESAQNTTVSILKQADEMHLGRCASSEPFTAQDYRNHACEARALVRKAITALSVSPNKDDRHFQDDPRDQEDREGGKHY